MTSLESRHTLAIWHGYLLGATGSNIYTNQLVRAWVRAGHDVVLACQESNPAAHPSIHEVVRLRWNAARDAQEVAERSTVREQLPGEGRCTMLVPDIDGVLPVYVLDRYAGFEVVRLVDLDSAGRQRYAASHAAAMRWVVEHHAPSGVLINHASPLPAALQPVLQEHGVPYAVKVHGSELEYAIVEDPSLAPAAAGALAASAGVLVGSDHITRRTAELLGPACLDGRVAVVPPGVDLEHFVPSPGGVGGDAAGRLRLRTVLAAHAEHGPGGRSSDTQDAVRALVAGDASTLLDGLTALQGTYAERQVEPTAPALLDAIAPDARLITFVGKLIPQKGLHLVLAALPNVLDAHPDAHLVVAGFGPLRDAYAALLVAMETGNAAAIDVIANGAGALAGESSDALAGLPPFLQTLRERGELDTWLARAAAHRLTERVTFLGLVDHDVLRVLWPECETSLVPSILAEAFGMVAAEAAACGSVPLVSDHSGLADAARVIEQHDVAPVRVPIDSEHGAVAEFASALRTRLSLPSDTLARQASAARANVAAAWGWDQLAEEVVALMTGAAAPTA